MILTGKDVGKKFGKTWIFRHLDFELKTGEKVAITGKNGVGKSTLLQIMASYLTPAQGQILIDDKKVEDQQHEVAFIGPYTEIVEEFTLKEFLNFHSQFKKTKCSIEEMAESASLPLSKVIGDFSTGMKQRTKLITAFFFQNDLIFMDEPTSNLDDEGFNWWKVQIEKLDSSLVVIASNDQREIACCSDKLNL